MNILIVGNCQAESLARLLAPMVNGGTVDYARLLPLTIAQLKAGGLHLSSLETSRCLDVGTVISDSDLVLLQNGSDIIHLFESEFPQTQSKVAFFPGLTFTGFHPDMITVRTMGGYHSSIACYGWMHGLSVAETVALFREEVFDALGFFDYWDAAVRFLVKAGDAVGLPLDRLIDNWTKQGVWMHTINHPKLHVLADLARAVLAREEISFLPDVERHMEDDLANLATWSVYPQIARRLGVEGGYQFKRVEQVATGETMARIYGLPDFVEASFKTYAKFRKDDFVSERLASPRYQRLESFVRTRVNSKPVEHHVSAPVKAEAASAPGRNPYEGLPDYQFWRRALERVPMAEVDPVVRPRFTLKREDKVATSGSCFAQHISRTLVKHGFNYFVAERGESLAPEEAQRRNYGVFSARFGNLYTTRQLVQLFDRAYGAFTPADDAWVRGDGRLVDPFRPQIEPDGFTTIEELQRSRAEHFAAVREMFETLDVMVFTFGLTEAWRSRVDGAAYPLAPGVVAGGYDAAKHEFVNFGVMEVIADMQAFVDRLLRVNPRARMILTVSPVPLIATYEDQHVLVSTTYSKSVLRVAAQEISQRNAVCAYFPSYEIIIGNYTRSEYYESDLRSVKPQGVDHVMRLFLAHYSSDKVVSPLDEELMRENAALAEVVCDEEAIDA